MYYNFLLVFVFSVDRVNNKVVYQINSNVLYVVNINIYIKNKNGKMKCKYNVNVNMGNFFGVFDGNVFVVSINNYIVNVFSMLS